ncbi:hypothetical protein [Streptomyces sp. NPDC048248]|uniref:hypothetical protein n=1 Tax=Streptomyces sp. NPDC048248 TaxID=3365523 RepID=UPI00371A1720
MSHQPPQTPPYGQPQPPTGMPLHGSAPQPPAPGGPRGRPGIIVAVVAVVVLITGGLVAWWLLGSEESPRDGAAARGLSAPKVVKSAATDLLYDKNATQQLYPAAKQDASKYPEFKGLTQVDSVYVPKDAPADRLAVHTAAGAVSDPAQRIEAAFGPNRMAAGPKTFSLPSAEARDGLLRCGVVAGDGDYLPLCVWADSGSVGEVLPLGEAPTSLRKVDLNAFAHRAGDFYRAMRGGSAG